MKYSVIFIVEEESNDFASFFEMIYDLFIKRNESFEVVIVANATCDFVQSQIDDMDTLSSSMMVIAFHQRVPDRKSVV